MNEPLYLITGATGATGGAAARELRQQGRRVRGLVHKDDARAKALCTLGIETIVGDLLDLDSIRRAMEGVAAAYFVYRSLTGPASTRRGFTPRATTG